MRVRTLGEADEDDSLDMNSWVERSRVKADAFKAEQDRKKVLEEESKQLAARKVGGKGAAGGGRGRASLGEALLCQAAQDDMKVLEEGSMQLAARKAGRKGKVEGERKCGCTRRYLVRTEGDGRPCHGKVEQEQWRHIIQKGSTHVVWGEGAPSVAC